MRGGVGAVVLVAVVERLAKLQPMASFLNPSKEGAESSNVRGAILLAIAASIISISWWMNWGSTEHEKCKSFVRDSAVLQAYFGMPMELERGRSSSTRSWSGRAHGWFEFKIRGSRKAGSATVEWKRQSSKDPLSLEIGSIKDEVGKPLSASDLPK